MRVDEQAECFLQVSSKRSLDRFYSDVEIMLVDL